MLMAPSADERIVRAYAAQTEAFRQAAALFAQPPEIVDIPFDGTPLPGHHFRRRRPRPARHRATAW
jgi:hypothetical protein